MAANRGRTRRALASSMNLHVAAADDPRLDVVLAEWNRLAAFSNQHELVDDPGKADAILFPWIHLVNDRIRLGAALDHPLLHRYPDKCFVYDESDLPWCALPGLYVSMPKSWFQPAYQRAAPYYTAGPALVSVETDLLFSFIGNESHPCRRSLLSLRHPDAVVERADGFVFYDANSPDFAARRVHFREVLNRSMFVLCPRGRGT